MSRAPYRSGDNIHVLHAGPRGTTLSACMIHAVTPTSGGWMITYTSPDPDRITDTTIVDDTGTDRHGYVTPAR